MGYTYDTLNRLDTIVTGSTTYDFAYDVYGNATSVMAGNSTLASYTYNANNGKLNILTYGNGLKVKYLYDSLDKIEEIQYNVGTGGAFETVYSYVYNSKGQLHSITDQTGGHMSFINISDLRDLVINNMKKAI